MTFVDSGVVNANSPWPGLNFFTESDVDFFHGRGTETEDLRRIVVRERVVVLFGASGLGKTSLLQAGLFPLARRNLLLPVSIRLNFADRESLTGQVGRAVVRAATAAMLDPPAWQTHESLWHGLHHRSTQIRNLQGQTITPLLVFDQFEELFTLGLGHPGRAAFLRELACLVEGYAPSEVAEHLERDPDEAAHFDFQSDGCRLVICLREDFMAELDGLRGTMPSLMQSRYRLRPLTIEKAHEVVDEPGRHLVEPGVTREIVEFVARRPVRTQQLVQVGSDDFVDPSILGVVCRELNNQRQESGLERISSDLLRGFGEEILATFYARGLGRLPPGSQDVARTFVEDNLVTGSGFRQAEPQPDVEKAIGKPALDTLVDARILRRSNREDGVWVELTHDVLLPVVTGARATRQEREAKLRAQQAQQELEARLAQETRQRRRAVLVGMGMLVLAAIAAITGYQSKQLADDVTERERRLDDLFTSSAIDRAPSASHMTLVPQVASFVRSHPKNAPMRALLAALLTSTNWPLPVSDFKQKVPFTSAWCLPEKALCATGADDGSVELWNANDGTKLRSLPSVSPGYVGVRFSKNGARLVVDSSEGDVVVYDAKTWTAVAALPKDQKRLNVSVRADQQGELLATSTPTRGNVTFIRASGEPAPAPVDPKSRLLPLVWAMDSAGTRMVTGVPAHGSVTFWRLSGPQAPTELWQEQVKGRGDVAVDAVAIADNGTVAAALRTLSVKIWTAAGKLLLEEPESSPVKSLVLDPSGRFAIWSVAAGGGVRVRWLGERRPEQLLPTEDVRSIEFDQRGRVLQIGGDLGFGTFWDPETGALLAQIPSQSIGSSDVVDGQRLFTASFDGRVQLWTTRAPALPEFRAADASFTRTGFVGREEIVSTWFNSETGLVRARRWRLGDTPESDVTAPDFVSRIEPAFTRDGKSFALVEGATDGYRNHISVRSFDGSHGRRVPTLVQDEWINYLRFSDDGRKILIAARDGDITIGDIDGEPAFFRNPNDAYVAKLSRHGGWLASTSDKKNAKLWRLEQGQGQEVALPTFDELVKEVALDPTENLLVTTAANRIRIWSLTKPGPKLLRTLYHDAQIESAAFDATGQSLVTSDSRQAVRVWDAATGYPIGLPCAHASVIGSVDLSPDGKRIASADTDGLTFVWDLVQPSEADAELIATLAEALIGHRWDEASHGLVPLDDVLPRLERVRKLAEPGDRDSDGKRLARWVLADPDERTISPFSRVTPKQLGAQLRALPEQQRAKVLKVLGPHGALLAR